MFLHQTTKIIFTQVLRNAEVQKGLKHQRKNKSLLNTFTDYKITIHIVSSIELSSKISPG